ncbi:hypothetical protein [Paenibacillus sp. MBLB4367]|uniref:hypothetical protein n=1 Tax=Paenibacillus sp. MBLB4367 TaxID=3384767 RepID=UPI0039082611
MTRQRTGHHNTMLKLSDDGIKMIHRLYLKGTTMPEIARLMKLTRNQIKNIVARAQKKEPEKWPPRKPGQPKKAPPPICKTIAERSLHGQVKTYHISELPQAEQDRMMNLVDPSRKTKAEIIGGWGYGGR